MEFIKKYKKVLITAVIILAAIIIAIIAGLSIYEISNSVDCEVSKSADGNVKLETSLEQLKEKNIEIGDDLCVQLSDGYKAKEAGLLSGDYLNPRMPIVTVNQDGSQIIFKLQNYNDLYNIAKVKENSKAHIKVSTKSKYVNLNKAMQMPKKNDVTDIRPLTGGKIKGLTFFRGTDPYAANQDAYVINYYFNSLKITNIVNLDNQKDGIHCMNLDELYCNYLIIDTLRDLCKNNDKTYFYAQDSDFTAYFCAIIEGFAGASYDKIVSDYMETYKNLYGITKESHGDEYEAIKTYHIDWFLRKIIKTTPTYDLSKCDYAYAMEMYLRSQGLSTDEITQLRARICL